MQTKCDFDRNHGVRPLPLLAEGSEVWVTMKDGIQVPGVVTEHADTPRSNVINTGHVRRNRLHLKFIKAEPGVNTDDTDDIPAEPGVNTDDIPAEQEKGTTVEDDTQQKAVCVSPPHRIYEFVCCFVTCVWLLLHLCSLCNNNNVVIIKK